MTGQALHSGKKANARQWVFNWRPLGSPFIPKLLSVLIAGALLGLLVTTLRIRVATPAKSSPRKASLIFLGDDPQSRALTLRAREGGPFPSRFELSSWEGLAEIERQAMEAASYQPPAYVPVLEDLSDANLVQPVNLAHRGETFFPKRKTVAEAPPDASGLKLAPVIYPLSAGADPAQPATLPPFDGVVDVKLSSPSWRFLVCLNSAGGVVDCTSLETADKAAADALEAWLRKVRFRPEPGKSVRWVALGIGFTNQPADGPDAR